MASTSQRFLASVFDQCGDSCGWTAAFIAALAYGTFGVPIKETVHLDVHPLVLQSYKTFTMFLFAWLVILTGESVRLTPWGLLSGLLWVLGGTGGIFAIRTAGMAIAVGTWSSVMILVNFLVGIVCFREPVASFGSTCGAFLCLAIGLVGMSIFSAPSPSSSSSSLESNNNPLMNHHESSSNEDDDHLHESDPPLEHEMASIAAVPLKELSVPREDGGRHQAVTSRVTTLHRGKSNEEMESLIAADSDPLRDPAEVVESQEDGSPRRDSRYKKEQRKFSWDNRLGLTKRELGILGAVMNGALTGFSLVPIHYAKKQGFGGAAYMLSFSSGALFANLMIWAVWFVAKVVMTPRDTTTSTAATTTSTSNSSSAFFQLVQQTYESMPAFHFKQLYIPGFSAGILLSIAMFGSILSVTYLGQGVGNSIIQSKILIR